MLARRVRTLMAAIVVIVPLIGVGSYAFVRHTRVQQAELKSEEDRRAAEAEDRRAAEAEANRKVEEAGKQRLAAEQERQAKAVAEEKAKRESEEVEQQRIAALKTAEEKGKRAEAEARSRYAALVSQGNTDTKAGNYDKAIADYNEAVRVDPKSALAFIGRGDAYTDSAAAGSFSLPMKPELGYGSAATCPD